MGTYTKQQAIDALVKLSEILMDNSVSEQSRIDIASRICIKIAKGLMKTSHKVQEEVR